MATGTVAAEIVDVDLGDELSEAYLSYASSVLLSRAIPDARDGLKPVQRRILWGAWRAGLRPDRPHVKSARVVGEVMGRYHPHGDQAIYDALVRTAQWFSLRVPLMDPHGNFGSPEDPPAAMRYTECRLTRAAVDLLAGVDEDTVPWRATYDASDREPVVLPAGWPNLVINGAAGIAVGLSTDIPPHNPLEVLEAVRLLVTDPDADISGVIPGPDFPTGGVIVEPAEAAEAVRTGEGTLRLRARHELVSGARGTRILRFTELPWGVGAEQVVARIRELVADGRLPGVRGVADLSDRTGVRLEVTLDPGADPREVLGALWENTPLEARVRVNMIALIAGAPVRCGLRDLLVCWLEHRRGVIEARTRHRLEVARGRLEILEGLAVAVARIDEVTRIVSRARRVDTALGSLRRRLGLTERQAEAVLDMPVRRLLRVEASRLATEIDGLRDTIGSLERILAEPAERDRVLVAELAEIVSRFDGARRTTIGADDREPLGVPPVVGDPDAAVPVGVSAAGALEVLGPRHRSPLPPVGVPARGRVGVVRSDATVAVFDTLLLPEPEPGEVVGVFHPDGDTPVVMVSTSGRVKRLEVSDLPAGTGDWPAFGGVDRVVFGGAAGDGDLVVVVTADGRVLVFDAAEVRPQRRAATGMVAIGGDSPVVGGGVVPAGVEFGVWLVTDRPGLRGVHGGLIPVRGRGGKGVRVIRLRTGENVVSAHVRPVDVPGDLDRDRRVAPADDHTGGPGALSTRAWGPWVVGAGDPR